MSDNLFDAPTDVSSGDDDTQRIPLFDDRSDFEDLSSQPAMQEEEEDPDRTPPSPQEEQMVQVIHNKDWSVSVPQSCLDEITRATGLEMSIFVGAGEFGVVFEACKAMAPRSADNCGYVVKIVPWPNPLLNYSDVPNLSYRNFGDSSHFMQECNISKRMGELGVGPRVLYYFTCPKMMALEAKNPFEGGLIVMERMAMTLEQLVEQRRIFVEENEQVIRGKFLNLVTAMIADHVLHNDIKLDNIMLRFLDQAETQFELRIVDWGFATDNVPMDLVKSEYLVIEHMNRFDNDLTFDLFRQRKLAEEQRKKGLYEHQG